MPIGLNAKMIREDKSLIDSGSCRNDLSPGILKYCFRVKGLNPATQFLISYFVTRNL